MPFKQVDIKTMPVNPFTMLDDEWGLVTAGTPEKYNAMTVSWGAMGIMWNTPVAIVFLRPQRYTKEFVDAALDSKTYPKKDYHHVYFGGIEKVFVKE